MWNAPSVFNRNRAPADHDIPHMFQLGYMYELPFGQGKKWATTGIGSAVLGGWQLNGIFGRVPGTAVHADRLGASLNMPGNRRLRTK